jgi:(p)ppGpp synthase/HD superfamily hydrolase
MPYTQRFEDAFVYAAHCLGGHLRKETIIPYITHLMTVAAIVGENGGTEDEVIAALLHDAPEDRGGKERLDDIRARYGDLVADIVEGCTETLEDPKPEWHPRKKAYVERMPDEPASVRLVSAADKLANAQNILFDLRDLISCRTCSLSRLV